ncbi:MAG: hypothetical protein WC264_00525 [Candidatus Paceibacterota bacterium]|jgi:hypothetical protein
MVYIISIENVISNYFEKNQDKKTVSLSVLNDYKKSIEVLFRKKGQNVIIDFTNASLINTVVNHPNLFDLKDQEIIFKQYRKDKLVEEVKNYFNSTLPFHIKEDYLKIFKKVNDKLTKIKPIQK